MISAQQIAGLQFFVFSWMDIFSEKAFSNVDGKLPVIIDMVKSEHTGRQSTKDLNM